jgi:hypothetical protein
VLGALGETLAVAFVEEYWGGVLRRLQAEVDGFNRLVAHHGERGKENELALARILQPLVPSRYAVGTGLLIDSFDNSSKQCDVVLFEQADQPRLLAQTTQLLHPVETVRAVIEVKTTLDPHEIRDAGTKKASVDALRPLHGHGDGSTHPLFMLFAYAADSASARVAANLVDLPPERRPDLLCLITPGVVAGGLRLLPSTAAALDRGDGYVVGATLLLDPEGSPVRPDGPGGHAEHGGRTYPVTSHDGTSVLGDPARALLLFADGLLRGLAAIDGFPPPVTSGYISARASELAPLARPGD